MNWLNIILIVYYVLVVIAIVHVVMDNRQPAKTMAWALVIYFVPVVGIVFYQPSQGALRKRAFDESANQAFDAGVCRAAEPATARET